MARRALLIGIPAYRSKGIPALPVVRNDVAQLERTLRSSGYEDVRVRGLGDLIEGTCNVISEELERFLAGAGDGDTLLVYLSGHGIHYDGRDYLIPSDASWRDPRDFPTRLFPIDFGAMADESPARTIVIFIDACREGVDLGVKAAVAQPWSQGRRTAAATRQLILCFACQPGEYAHYTTGDEGFSVFGRALAAVLDPAHPARTLGELLSGAQAELTRIARDHETPPQTLRWIVEMEHPDAAGALALERIVCDGQGAEPARGEAANPWTAAALGAEIWNRERLQACPWLGELRRAVAVIADACFTVHQARNSASRPDPWTSPDIPGRALDALGLLLVRSAPPIELNAGETALAVIAPFVHEAMYAVRWVEPLADDEAAVEIVRRAHPQFVRAVERAVEHAAIRPRAAEAAHAWLVHRALAQRPSAALPEPLTTAMAAAAALPDRIVAATFSPERLLALARAVAGSHSALSLPGAPASQAPWTSQAPQTFGHPGVGMRAVAHSGDSRAAAHCVGLRAEVPAGGHGDDRRLREQLIGHLLRLAGWLALNPRMFSDVLFEHLSQSEPVDLTDLHVTLARAAWLPAHGGIVLHARCHHPAVDMALREHVEHIADLFAAIHKHGHEPAAPAAPLAGLPRSVYGDDIAPAAPGTYELPHVRFHLSAAEVQEILMGEQLYGDPALAIRELYQNALDACRYRRARTAYLERTERIPPSAWQGRITFRQGEHQGRPYIECEDNGIGMDHRVVAEVFARAGRRFHDSTEFAEELLAWSRCEPPIEFYPNSQFGIGVFSYFMLADELELETCRFERNGRIGETLHINISGSGSLFRIRTSAVPRADAGTRIRLYLSRTRHEDQPISSYRTLRELLWVAEFTTANIEGKKRFVWRPGELVHPRMKSRDILPAPGGTVWWLAEGAGEILSDGLVVKPVAIGANRSSSMVSPTRIHKYAHWIINLDGKHRPELTVDRRHARRIDWNYINQVIIDTIDIAQTWPRLTMAWLWDLPLAAPHAAEKLVRMLLADAAVTIPLSHKEPKVRLPISLIGCCHMDSELIELVRYDHRDKGAAHISAYIALRQSKQVSASLAAHRHAAWKQIQRPISASDNKSSQVPAAHVIGSLSPEQLEPATTPACAMPLDFIVLSERLDGNPPWREHYTAADIQRAAKAIGETAEQVRERLRKYVPYGLRVED